MNQIRIPDWALVTAQKISEQRNSRFQNQFVTNKLKSLGGNDAAFSKVIEGVIGYIGDICASIWLGKNPVEEIKRMILDTGLLRHRDTRDLSYKGLNVDIKTEVVPEDLVSKIASRQIRAEVPYGCRLINATQFTTNGHSVDVYLFGLLDKNDPRTAQFWLPVGFLYKDDIKKICPEPVTRLGARKLHAAAYALPTARLRDPSELSGAKRDFMDEVSVQELVDKLDYPTRKSFEDLCKRVGLE